MQIEFQKAMQQLVKDQTLNLKEVSRFSAVDFRLGIQWLVAEEKPELAQALLTKISTATIAYAQMQINTGIHLFQLFDSWAGVLNAEWYRTLILPHVERILSHIQKQIPVTFFAKGAHYALSDFDHDIALLAFGGIH